MLKLVHLHDNLTKKKLGQLAQLVERLPYKQVATGSSPVLPILILFSRAHRLRD